MNHRGAVVEALHELADRERGIRCTQCCRLQGDRQVDSAGLSISAAADVARRLGLRDTIVIRGR